MRKTRRRLTLSRETLYRLEDESLGRAVGGSLESCMTDCGACDPDEPDPQPTSAPSFCPCVL